MKVASAKRLPIRGGNWNNGSNAGVFYLNLNNGRTNANNNLGSRLALITRPIFNCIQLKLSNITKGDVDRTDKLPVKLSSALLRLVTCIKDNIAKEIQP